MISQSANEAGLHSVVNRQAKRSETVDRKSFTFWVSAQFDTAIAEERAVPSFVSTMAAAGGAGVAVPSFPQFVAKREWAVFFARALPSATDCSQGDARHALPAWAALHPRRGADDPVNRGKPLWLTLLHEDGETRSCASLDSFEALDDKVVLAEALAAAGAADLAPPQLTFAHDEEHDSIVARIEAAPLASLCVEAGESASETSVLKWAQGFGGQDIHFVHSANAAAAIITEAHAMLDDMPLIAGDDEDAPSDDVGGADSDPGAAQQQCGWVLQALVPSVLVQGRKIHLRTYVVAVQSSSSSGGGSGESRDGARGEALGLFAYNRHEVRMAAASYNDNHDDKDAHLTTGQWRRGGTVDDRTTLDAVPELQHMGLGPKVLAAVDRLCSLLPFTANERVPPIGVGGSAFGLTGLDFMVTEDGRVFLLEFNASPAAPPPATVSDEHVAHLEEFAAALVQLVGSARPDTVAGFTRVGAASPAAQGT